MSITVYSAGPTCTRCRLSINILNQAGVVFEVVDITTDAFAPSYVMDQLGHTQAPVIVVTDAPAGHRPHQDHATAADQPGQRQHWSGFRPDRLHALTQTTTVEQNGNR